MHRGLGRFTHRLKIWGQRADVFGMRSKLVSAIAALLLAFLTVASPASAQEAPPAEDPRGLLLLSDQEHDWLIRRDAWLNLSWTSDVEITNFQVTADSSDRYVTIEYPENTPGFSGPLNGATLSPNEIDFTAIFVRTTWRAADVYTIDLNVTYEEAGQPKSETIVLTFNETMWDGDTFVLVNDTATIDLANGELGGWVELDYIGIAPQLWDVRITIDTELDVELPRGSYTSMHRSKSLRADERDVARLYFDPAQLAAGDEYVLVIETAYKTGDKDNWDREEHRVVLNVIDSRNP